MTTPEPKNAIAPAARWELWLKTLALIGALIGAGWTYRTYVETKEREFYEPFWTRKMELFLNVSQHASTMATATKLEDFVAARAAYWELFYGRLSMVEGEEVKQAMIQFSQLIPKGEPATLPVESLEQPAYRLTLALKKELGESWKKPFGELP